MINFTHKIRRWSALRINLTFITLSLSYFRCNPPKTQLVDILEVCVEFFRKFFKDVRVKIIDSRVLVLILLSQSKVLFPPLQM